MQLMHSGRGAVAVLALIGFGCAAVPPGVSEPLENPAETEPLSSVPSIRSADNSVPFETRKPLVVVLNDPGNQHLDVLQVFSARLGRPYQIFNLADRSREAVAAALAALAPIDTVVLGPAAYSAAGTIPGVDVFYAGVLDPGRTSQGVDALPPFGVQLDYWQGQVPGMRRLGVIGSPAMTARVDALAEACVERGIKLERRQVNSDTETLLGFRAMVPHIDGFVFLPDESVLSPRVIREVMSHGRQNDVQMLVYSPLMFNLGASIFVQPDPVQVALALIELLENPGSRPRVAGMRTKSRLAGQRQLSAADSGFRPAPEPVDY